MGYHHKRDACARDAKDILANVLRSKCDEYELIGSIETVKVASAVESILNSGNSPNQLRSVEDQVLSETSIDESRIPEPTDRAFNSMEQYQSIVNIRFDDIETKDAYTRIRKRAGDLDSR